MGKHGALLKWSTSPTLAISAFPDLCIWGTIVVANITVSPGTPLHKANAI
jgi:hypothetical protein